MKKLFFTQAIILLGLNVLSAQLKMNSSGAVGIGCDAGIGSSVLRIYKTTMPHFVLAEPNSYIQMAIATGNGGFSNFAQNGDAVYRHLGTSHNLIFCMPNVSNNGNSYIKFGDDANGGWFSIFNNKKIRIDGKVGIGKNHSLGLLDVNGSIYAGGNIVLTSDERLKTEIKSLSDEKDKLYLLRGKSYKKTLPPTETKEIRYRENGEEYFVEKKIEITEFSEYGYLAQELKEIFPDLVTQDSAGYYGVNYIGLIPVIVEALKDQRQEIEKQREQIDELTGVAAPDMLRRQQSGLSVPVEGKAASLEQNIPNPFNQNTAIKYYLPETVTTAYLCFYDLQGKQLKQIMLLGRGEGSQTVQGSQFSPGIYLYALIADGQEVDVKRMILTE